MNVSHRNDELRSGTQNTTHHRTDKRCSLNYNSKLR